MSLPPNLMGRASTLPQPKASATKHVSVAPIVIGALTLGIVGALGGAIIVAARARGAERAAVREAAAAAPHVAADDTARYRPARRASTEITPPAEPVAPPEKETEGPDGFGF